jgi:hypothetical protein
MALVYLPDSRDFFLWGEQAAPRALPGLAEDGKQAKVDLVLPGGAARVAGTKLPLLPTVARLAVVPASVVTSLPPSIGAWSLASKLALDLVARERMIPTVMRRDGKGEARWAVALAGSEDAAGLGAIARSMPPSAHAVPAPGGEAHEAWAPEAAVRAFLDETADALVRTEGGRSEPSAPERPARGKRGARKAQAHARWERRWHRALAGPDSRFEPDGFAERTLIDDLVQWGEPILGARERLRACFRLELPVVDEAFTLRFLLQSPDDPSLLVSAAEVWETKGRSLTRLGRAFRDPQESLLEALGRAARLFALVSESLGQAMPESLALDPGQAWTFLSEGAPALAEAGFGVIVPGELTAAGERRLRLRMKVGTDRKVAGAVAGAAGLTLAELLSFEWEAALGDATLTARELRLLAKQKAPLVRYRGAWVAVDPRELREIEERLARGPGRMAGRQAVQAALAGEIRHDGLSVLVSPAGALAQMIEEMRRGAAMPAPAPATLRATLRPYQARGLAWLATMGRLELGACLADDMGLGKTIQLLAFLLHRLESAPTDRRPALLVAPTSVVGNWEREVERFAPRLRIVRHYGAGRPRNAADIPRAPETLVLTTYGLLRRDGALLSDVEWSVVVLDEAQNIKNAASATARAARALGATHRFALTGTPVENRLAELWSILEFANPGLLGPLDAFRRDYAVPIERYRDDHAAARLHRIVSPFLLRRLKSDPAIIDDLPPKNEMRVICTLTQEQATLYQAVVDEEMRRIEESEGIERHGRVLALLSFLKQICNHPAQYLGESGPLAGRSGKLARLAEMLEEAIAAGDKALVFTQFREMGERLVGHLASCLGVEVLFLHGGTPKRARDAMVGRFQDEPNDARVFVLSVKAGGTGLNLTAASHVFHFDRWWNPAVEDQATDRAYRIGQKRALQVHKLVCAGTVEEKVDQMLEEKRVLAAMVVGADERWITELGDADLRALFTLAPDASIGGDEDDRDGEGAPAKRRRLRSARAEAGT